MPEFTAHQPGTFCWADLASPDSDASKNFYGQLMGWTFWDNQVDQGPLYTLCRSDGKNVCGLFEMDQEKHDGGLPPKWACYLSAANLEVALAAATSAGASVVVEPVDVGDEGRFAYITDPNGAGVGLWQPGQHIGAQVMYESGAVGWNELNPKDLSGAVQFYGEVFGWDSHEVPGPGGTAYIGFEFQGQAVGGMMTVPPEWGEVPPGWSVYFRVENFALAVQKAQELGAAVVVPPTQFGAISFAFLQDPQRAFFGVAEVV